MDEDKRRALEAEGFAFGDAEDFMELTPNERMIAETLAEYARWYTAVMVRKAYFSGMAVGMALGVVVASALYMWKIS